MRGATTNGEFWIFFAYKRGIERSYYACTALLKIDRYILIDRVSLLLPSPESWMLIVDAVMTVGDQVENTGVWDAFDDCEIPLNF